MDNKSKWFEFSVSEDYKLVDLGRTAIFLIPMGKLNFKMNSGQTVAEHLREFLSDEFGAFTTPSVASHGVYVNDDKVVYQDECQIYEVSFLGKERIPMLMKKLAEIATAIGEECIYLRAGQYSSLVVPKQQKTNL